METQNKRSMWFLLPLAGALASFFAMTRRKMKPRVAENKDRALLEESNLDLQAALNIALKYVPGVPVEIELEEDHGMPVWEVEIVPRKGGPTREVIIDAKTGDILEVKAEYPEAA